MAGLQISTAGRNQQLASWLPSVGSDVNIEIRTGTQPGNADTALTGTLLASVAIPDSSIAAPAGGVMTVTGSHNVAAAATGTAGYWAWVDAPTGAVNAIGPCGTTAGDGVLVLSSLSVTSGQPVTVDSWQVTAGNA